MKAIRKSDGKIIEVEPQRFMEQNGAMYAPSELDFNVKESEEVTINGWVARDIIGTLCLFIEKPKRNAEWWSTGGYGLWVEPNDDLYPSVTWESDPLEVTITLKPKKR